MTVNRIDFDSTRSSADKMLAHLKTGSPITRLEGLLLFGINDLASTLKDMRQKHGISKDRMKRERVTIESVVQRLNDTGVIIKPSKFDERLKLTAYSLKRK